MNRRIAVYLDPGLGWTKPLVVACCGICGAELARSSDQVVAERSARRTRCSVCGTRTARRLPGTTSPATDLALAHGRPPPLGRRWLPARHPARRRAGRR